MKSSLASYVLIPCIFVLSIFFLVEIENLTLVKSLNYTFRVFSAVILGAFSLAIGFGYVRILLRSKELTIYFLVALAFCGYLFYGNDTLVLKYIAIASLVLFFVGLLSKALGVKGNS